MYFDPENIVKLAVEGGCNAVASTFGVLGMVARKYAHKIPFLVKINHNELLTYPNKADQILWVPSGKRTTWMCRCRRDDLLPASPESGRQIVGSVRLSPWPTNWAWPPCCVLFTQQRLQDPRKDYHVSADLTGQANHLGVTIEADIIKQKLPENNGGYEALNMGGSSYGKFDKRIYTDLASDHPIDLCRYQVANCYMGRAGLINSGGESKGAATWKRR